MAPDIFTLDPIADRRWDAFVTGQRLATVFHTVGWLDAIRRTYGYQPVVYTTAAPDATLTNGILLCRVESWITGKRLVGVPFADHCDPLVADARERSRLFGELERLVHRDGWRYIEFRPYHAVVDQTPSMRSVDDFCLHTLDLRPSIDELFGNLHHSSIRRKVRRAKREGLRYEVGTSDALVEAFYRLLLLTRRRHQLPPQPLDFFRNLIECLKGRVNVHLALSSDRPVGAIVTLRHANTLVYKYGASDAVHHKLGTMPFLFWNAIVDAKNAGIDQFDLGRSRPENTGLLTFKDHLGAARSAVQYVEYSRSPARRSHDDFWLSLAKPLFYRMPDRVLMLAGKFLYRHVG